MRLAIPLVLLLSVAPAFAQTTGSCALGFAEADLDISDVRARFFTTGSLFYGNTTTSGNGYLVPKASGNSPIFAAGIWVGGLVGGEIRVAGARYNSFEFWPGPLEPGATLPNPDDCSPFDRIWTVSVLDIEAYDDTGATTDDLSEWPADLGAPVVDGDGIEGNYNLAGGDRPALYGDQAAFWVMNDVGNEHQTTGSAPIGLEVRVTAFASTEDALSRHTFYRYELVNRNTQPFEAARFGLFVDPDLGSASDDYVGSDSARSMAFVYNASETDANYGVPPAAGYDFLSGGDLAMYFENLGSCVPTADPCDGEALYNYLTGRWADGTLLTEGGNGYASGGQTLSWAFPGAPETEQFWSEVNVNGQGSDNPPGDRRNVIVSAPFTLAPGETRTVDFTLLFAQGEDHLDSIAELRVASDAVQALYDNGDLFPLPTVDAEADPLEGLPGEIQMVAFPNPTGPSSTAATVRYQLPASADVRIVVFDVLGREVAVLDDGPRGAGEHEAQLATVGLPSGLYVVRLTTDTSTRTRRLTIVR